MTIIEKLRGYTDLKLHYQSQGNINDILDNAVMPCSFAYLAQNAQLIEDGLGTRKRINVLIFFVDLTKFDFGSSNNDAIISQMEIKAMEFLKALRADNKFYLIQNYGLKYIYDYFDVNVTGVGLDLLIEETNCFTK